MEDLNLDNYYGDIVVLNDIQKIRDKDLILNIISDTLNTNMNDYRLNPTTGANLDSFIGVGINKELLSKIRLRLITTISDSLSINEIDVIPYVIQMENNNLYIRLIIKNIYTEDIVVTKTFNIGIEND